MKKFALAAAFGVAASTSFAGNVEAPVMEPVIILEEAASSSDDGLILPLIILILVAAAAAGSSMGSN